MHRLGFGVYQNYTTHDSVLEAFSAGYRQACRMSCFSLAQSFIYAV